MHHYEGVAGTERLVRVTFVDGEVLNFRGERGVERHWVALGAMDAPGMPTGYSPGCGTIVAVMTAGGTSASGTPL